MQSNLLIKHHGFILFGFICSGFLATLIGTMTGEWISTNIGLMNLTEIYCLAARTGFSFAFAGLMCYSVLFVGMGGRFPLLSFLAWHGIELIITIAISIFVVLYKLDEVMLWYRHEALIFVPLLLLGGLIFGWVIRFIAKHVWLYKAG